MTVATSTNYPMQYDRNTRCIKYDSTSILCVLFSICSLEGDHEIGFIICTFDVQITGIKTNTHTETSGKRWHTHTPTHTCMNVTWQLFDVLIKLIYELIVT